MFYPYSYVLIKKLKGICLFRNGRVTVLQITEKHIISFPSLSAALRKKKNCL